MAQRSDFHGFSFLVSVMVLMAVVSFALLVRGDDGESWTLRALRMFPRHESDRTEGAGERDARLIGIADTIDAVTTDKAERALLLSVAWHESRFASSVQFCEVLGDNGRAVGLWQSHALTCPADTIAQAREAQTHLERTARACGGNTGRQRVFRAVSLYATGRHCSWVGAEKRAETWARLMEVP